MHIPAIMLPLDVTRAAIWEMGRDYADLGKEVTDCSLYCGCRQNHHPGLTVQGKRLWRALSEEDQIKVEKAFFWAHFLYGHDGLTRMGNTSIPDCRYCYTPGELSPQDKYVQEVLLRQSPDYYNKQYEGTPGRDFRPYTRDYETTKVRDRAKPTPQTRYAAPDPSKYESVAEYIKADTNYMNNLQLRAAKGFKERKRLMDEIFDR